MQVNETPSASHTVEVITELTPEKEGDWNEFLQKHPEGNIYQSPGMYSVYRDTPGYDPLVLFTRNPDGVLNGIMLSVRIRSLRGLAGALTSRSVIWGGPLTIRNDSGLVRILFEAYRQNMQSDVIYTQVRNIFPHSNWTAVLEEKGYTWSDHLNILVGLDRPEEEIWKDVHSKRRNEIRRAPREGTIFRPDNSVESLDECYKILKTVYARARHPLPDKKYFGNLHRHLEANQQIRIFTARHTEKIVGCMICLAWESTLYDLYAGSYPEYYNVYPNDLIPWEVFKWGRENGYTRFDFGGAGKPGVPYGVRDYKKKFGGEMIHTGRFECRHRPVLYSLASAGLKTYKRLQKH